MAPEPITARRFGRSSSSNMVSLVSAASPNTENCFGNMGVEPVAMTMVRASTTRPSSRWRRPAPVKLARARTATPSGRSWIDSRVRRANLSRSARTRRSTAGPSILMPSTTMPKSFARLMRSASRLAAINNLEGMQPTSAQVVPPNSGSMSSVEAPFLRAARSAARPAVPPPITATSQQSVVVMRRVQQS
ncbi:hypothetical protein SAMN05518668_11648 [Sphingobium sp. YR657]|nr:hypothetical protein SAMN05518668_11648 [Sphingobium sp. YR657]